MLVRGRVSRTDPLWAHLRFYSLFHGMEGQQIVVASYQVSDVGMVSLELDIPGGGDWEEQIVHDSHFRFDGEPQVKEQVVVWNSGDKSKALIGLADPRLWLHEGCALQAFRERLERARAGTDIRMYNCLTVRLEGILRQQSKAWQKVAPF